MKNIIIAAAIVATTTLSVESFAGDRERPFRIKLAQCVEPYQGHEVTPQAPAYMVTLQTQTNGPVNYLVDNQFAIKVGIPLVPDLYGYHLPFDSYAIKALMDRCQEDQGDTRPCVFLNSDEIDPGPRTDGVNARPKGAKFQ